MCVFFGLLGCSSFSFRSNLSSPPGDKTECKNFPETARNRSEHTRRPGGNNKNSKSATCKTKGKVSSSNRYVLFAFSSRTGTHTHTLASQARAHKHTVFHYRKRRLSSAHAHMGRWRTRALGGIERKRHRFPANEIEMFFVLVCCCFLFECSFFSSLTFAPCKKTHTHLRAIALAIENATQNSPFYNADDGA